jgi:hypothetical protein
MHKIYAIETSDAKENPIVFRDRRNIVTRLHVVFSESSGVRFKMALKDLHRS